MNKNLKRDWSEGKKSALQVLQDGSDAKHQGAAGLGKLGRDKVHAQNAHRDLSRAVGWPVTAPELTWIDLGGARSHPVICPTSLWEKLWDSDQRRFEETIIGDRNDISQLWNGMVGTPVYEHSKHVIDHAKSIALGLHGDGAPTHKCDGLFTIAWNSLTGRGPTRQTRYIFAVIKKSDIEEGTLTRLWDYLAWAMNALSHGRFPERDHRGRRHPRHGELICKGAFRGICIQLRGDWEFYCQALDYPSAGDVNCCFLCNATSGAGPLNCYNAALDAGWRPGILSHASYCAQVHANGDELSALYGIDALCHEGVTVDVLHAVDQGLASHVVANTFVELIHPWGPNQAARTAALEARIKTYYDVNRESSKIQGKLTFERLKTSNDWPKLKAKAAATRHLAAFALELAAEADDSLPPGASPAVRLHSRRRRAVCQLLVRFSELLDGHGRYFTVAAKTEIAEIGRNLVTIYSQLSAESVASEQRMWKLTPKFHIFIHLCEIQCITWGNPRWYWTYSDEDLQKIMKQVALSCHPSRLSSEVLRKWVVNVFP
jgi:hypothetical protein